MVGALDAITHAGDSVRAIVKFVTQESAIPVYRQRFSSSFGEGLFSTALTFLAIKFIK